MASSARRFSYGNGVLSFNMVVSTASSGLSDFFMIGIGKLSLRGGGGTTATGFTVSATATVGLIVALVFVFVVLRVVGRFVAVRFVVVFFCASATPANMQKQIATNRYF